MSSPQPVKLTPPLNDYHLELEGTEIVLLPSKLVWWPERKTLFMADSHFGKASTFRKAGLAVPEGTTTTMLSVLSAQIHQLAAEKLIVLGDLIHSNTSAQRDFEEDLARWRQLHHSLNLVLVKGNHDIKPAKFYHQLGFEVMASSQVVYGPFELCHDPQLCSTERFSLCGHLHPAVHIAGAKLSCFWLRPRQLVLPAFGAFTGTARIKLAPNERALAICDGQLISIPNFSRP